MAQDDAQSPPPPAQQTQQATPPQQTQQTPPAGQPPALPQTTAPQAKSLPQNEPWPDTSDHQFSFMPFYWLTTGRPVMQTGHAAVPGTSSDLNYDGKANRPTYGAVISFPAGKHNTLRIEYFRTNGSGNTVAPQNVTYFNLLYASGTYLAVDRTLQNFKATWDYLSWPFPVNPHKFQVKSLWEVQYTTITTKVNGPFLPVVDNVGNPLQTATTGSNHLIYPTFGLGAEKFLSKHFRWEAKASAFAFPHRAATWDANTFLAYRGGPVEVDAGYKIFYFKTSPNGTEYVHERLAGAYVGLRWYPKF